MNKSVYKIFILIFIVSCSGINEERTTGTFIEDFSIERKIKKFINRDYELDALTNVKATSYNEVLLLTGQIPNERLRREIISGAKQITKIKKIHDFTILAAPSSMLSRSNDKYLTTKVRTRILATAIFKKEKNVKSNRIKVVTDNSTVFLLGIVNNGQADIATKIARETSGVQKVVTLWEIK
ncbi:MAG: hypothetical protein CBC29_03990 [Methylococcaceae bacterium TMED69]|nr:MAG: hypothetical protein CBC29_03990 [Methylococcaceae bacterium TMED69]|tara:strand:- start:2039 stop:2584 length:546 start_codon:yes stop_codon:yes gene_type:complete